MDHLSDVKREKSKTELKLKELEADRVRIEQKISKLTVDLIEEDFCIASGRADEVLRVTAEQLGE